MTLSLVLASSSPRRRELLALTGWKFEINPADIDESPRPGEPPGDYVLRLAVDKAHVAAIQASPAQIVLAADTTVADGADLLGKPANKGQAVAMLEQLRGRVHQVYTAIALLAPGSDGPFTDLCTSQVPMRNYTASEIETYAASGDPMDKAGAYAIQHAGFHPVEGFAGCFASVMGLPLCHLTRTLTKMGLPPQVDVPAACQAHLNYRCPVFRSVLNGENVG
jgi:septum formation protein